MAKSYPSQLNPGSFVPITDVFDVSTIQDLDINSAEFKEFLVRVRQNINDIAMVLNTKNSGYYYQQEFVDGNIFFPNPSLSSTTPQAPTPRQEYRKVINFGALPNTTSKAVAHGITFNANTTVTRLYASATDPSTSYIPIPYASPTLANNIELSMDGTNVTITTGSDRTGYTICYVVIEYLQQ